MNDEKTFLDSGYTVPDRENGYMKFKVGENRFRIISKPIVGWEWWVREDGTVKSKEDKPLPGDHPVRVRHDQAVPVEAAETAKHFWAMVVWNFKVKQLQILELTQKGIQKAIENLTKKPSWGAPYFYDIVVEKTGEGLDTEYTVTPEPKTERAEEIEKALKAVSINLEALFEGQDPFNTERKLEEVEDISDEELDSVLV